MSLAGWAWRIAATLAAPALPWSLARRARRGKEIGARLRERWGDGADRPTGRLLWLHAASVGETVSILPVLSALAEQDPALHLLLTTGTVTSAELLAARLPAELAGRLQHRFVPLDVPGWVARFLDAWRPDAGAFVESELWPNLLGAAAARGIPMALLNARMSPRSAARWQRMPGFAREVLGCFRLVLARSEAEAALFARLGATGARSWGDLKAAAVPLPADPAALAALRESVTGRPVFLAASTHPGEEAMAFAAHSTLAVELPALLTVVAPRHRDRGAAVAAAAVEAGLVVARRGAGALPDQATQVYVADTMGELGLLYRLAGVALVGGSLVPLGGQNPLEAARLRCPILFGPHMWNFEEPVARLLEAGGAVRLDRPAALASAVRDVLTMGDRGVAMADAAAAVADLHAGLPHRVAKALLGLLPPDIPAEAPREGHDAGPVTNEV